MIIITPTEALTRQHAGKLRALSAWNVFAYPLDGDAFALGRQPPGTVIVLDINKLAVEKKGDGITVPVSVFAGGRNLVCVDEGHKGQKAEASVWKAIQSTLAGIGPGTPHAERGLLIEFSATFGQVVEAEHSFDRYAKAVVFDYAYDRFHRDRYGKDFWYARLQTSQDAEAAAYTQTLTAALLAFWHQVSCYRALKKQPAAAREGVRIEAPLWVLLGLSVIGGSANQGDKDQTSDVVNVLAWLAEALSSPERLAESLRQVLAAPALGQADGATLLPPAVRQGAAGMAIEALSARVLGDCFGWQPSEKPVLRLIRSAPGELGLGLSRGDTVRYYGVVNVGDAPGLKKALEARGLPVEEEALHGSLFAGLDHPGSPLNVLIGSRRFAEGWDNYRASSLTLLRLGQSEGSLIIQMFGRVVRFAGTRGDGKRLATPPPGLEPLQTAYVYGLKSGYLQTFLNSLTQNGVIPTRRITCDIDRRASADLRIVRNDTPALTDFQVAAHGDQWLNNIRPLSLNLTASIAAARLVNGRLMANAGLLGEDITAGFKRWLPLLDREAVYRDLLEWRRARGYWNFRFDRAAIAAALRSDQYHIQGLPDTLAVRHADDLARLQRLATAIVRQLFERTYRQQQPGAPVLAPLAVEPKQYSREEPDAH
jgi:hypothetical protein